jgi:hypothetical protein
MNPEPLPANLRELEARLANRPLPGPSDDFRSRVQAATRDAMPPAFPAPRWRIVWRSAVAVVVLLNAWLCVANGLQFRRLDALNESVASPPAPSSAPDSDDRLESLRASALARLKPTADFRPGGRGLLSQMEDRAWDTP